MSENKRSLQDVQNDYTRVCARLGHVEYNIAVMKKDADAIKGELQALNLEAAALNAEQAKEEAAKAEDSSAA